MYTKENHPGLLLMKHTLNHEFDEYGNAVLTTNEEGVGIITSMIDELEINYLVKKIYSKDSSGKKIVYYEFHYDEDDILVRSLDPCKKPHKRRKKKE